MGRHVATVTETVSKADAMIAFWHNIADEAGLHPSLVENYHLWKSDRNYFADTGAVGVISNGEVSWA